MLDLRRYLDNPFTDRQISRNEAVAFTADFLGRIVGQNTDGRYDAIIASVSTLFEQLEGRLADEATAQAVQIARTAATTAKRDLIHTALSSFEGLVHARLERGSPAYLGVFPSGLQEFRAATLDTFNAKLRSLLERAAPHAAAIARVTTLQGEWATLRGEQVDRKGAAATAEDTRRAVVDALRVELFDALLVIAREEKGKPERLSLYMDQSLLEDRASADEDAAPAVPAPPVS